LTQPQKILNGCYDNYVLQEFGGLFLNSPFGFVPKSGLNPG